ncbi:LOW QUALITY PROTEIN: HMCT-like protein [Mya arenaria]|uniref:HMCT-like protein n=1 Tax=Mya arenaria TaxID=6604 RepID=A0ABY7EN59_MYAAR|nr:LOW QUALITY PROTEIN: HMCT-like protein [Mya arenaria]
MKTCDNRLVYDTLIQDCGQETCVEGCDIEPCQPGQVYESNKEPFKCIPEAFCNTTCLTLNGKEYKEGENPGFNHIYCDQHQVKRTGVCTGTPPPHRHLLVTVSPPIFTASPAVPTMTAKCVQNGHTAWMSVSVPTPYNQGDVDSIRNLRSQYTFCDASQMTAIECRVVGTTTSLCCWATRLPHTTTVAPNTLPTGSPTPRRMDLGISTTTLHPNQTFVTPPKLPSPSTECKEPGWTNWMNSVKPVDGNDIEFLPGLVKSFGFCREDQIAYTQCRRVSDKLSFDDTEDLQTVCSTKAGFACYGSNQPDGRCDDYEFRVYCQCENSGRCLQNISYS